MATRYAVATGNWSALATWDGGTTLPGSGDDVYADGKTVTIDQDVTVLSLRTTQRAGGTAGGGFTCSTARTIDVSGGSGIVTGSATCLTLSHTSGSTVTLTGAVNGTQTTNSVTGLVISGTGTTNITGAVTGGSVTTCRAIDVNAAATVTITGNVAGGSGNGAIGINSGVASTIAITGNVTGGNGNTSHGVLMNTSYTGSLTVTGTVTGASGNSGTNIAAGINTTALTTVTGTIQAGTTGAAIVANNTLTASGPILTGSSGVFPISTPVNGTAGYPIVKLTGITNNEFRFLKSTGGTTSLWSSDVNSGAPSAANVRKGTTFGVSNEFVGTAAIPAAQNVVYGVPVDATTGTASITADKWLSPL